MLRLIGRSGLEPPFPIQGVGYSDRLGGTPRNAPLTLGVQYALVSAGERMGRLLIRPPNQNLCTRGHAAGVLSVFSVPVRTAICLGVLAALGCSHEPTSSSPQPAVARVTIAPYAVIVHRDSTHQLTAVAEDSAGNTLRGVSVTWSSSDTTRVRVSAAGLVRAVGQAGAEIEAMAGGKKGYADVFVVDGLVGLRIAADSFTVDLGQTVTLWARVDDSSGYSHQVGPALWRSSDTAVATVDSFGLVRTRRVGKTAISVEVPPVTTTDTLSVRAVVASVAVEPDTASVVIGQTLPLAAVVRDSAGDILSGRPVGWSVCCGLSMTVSPLGLVTAAAGGPTRVVAVVAGRTDTATITGLVDGAFRSMSAGYVHTCATTTAGTTYCWGNGWYGQLGAGFNIQGIQPSPALVAGGVSFASAAAYGSDNCALAATGEAYCWGLDDQGQLGNATGVAPCTYGDPCRGTPLRAADTLRFQIVAPGGAHTCGVSIGGPAYCWGDSVLLGNGGAAVAPEAPALVSGGLTFTAMASGELFTCGLASTGTVYCWGGNSVGELGAGASDGSWHLVPQAVAGGQSYSSLAAGKYHACALTGTGTVYCWGDLNGATPGALSSPAAFTTLVAGDDYTCGLTSSGAAYCWGGNSYGQLGDSTTTTSNTPVAVSGGLHFTALVAGGLHVCGLSTNGRMYCWGDNNNGEVGDGTYYVNSRPTPTLVTGQP